jgi:hypothetical protein
VRREVQGVKRETSGIEILRSMMPLRALKSIAAFLLCLTPYVLLLTGNCHAGIKDRVIASVDDQAITMSELDEQYRNTVKISPDITVEEVLDTMINRILILREARKYRIEAASLEQVMHEYIDLKIRAFIRVGENDIEQFFQENRDKFAGKEFEDVRDEIDAYLTEKELNARLKETLKELRRDAYIRVFLER